MNKSTTRKYTGLILTSFLLASASLSQAQSPIVYNFASGLQGWAGNGDSATYSWNATGGSTGGGCMQVVIDGTTATEADPYVTLATTLNQAQYYSVTLHMMVDPNSGTGGNGYFNLQAIFRDAGWSWDSIWHGGVSAPAANNWVTYTFVITSPYKSAEKYLQFQLSSGATSSPVTNYIDNITITPLPNPLVVDQFTNSSFGGWDGNEDAPYVNPVLNTTPVNITPAGSWNIQISNPSGYSGWNQYGGTYDYTRYQWFGFDVYLDSSSGTSYGGIQFLAQNNGNWNSWVWVGSLNFTPAMVGKWTHFNFACAGSGLTGSQAFSIQGTPGSDGGTNTTTFHIDNIQFWSPTTRPIISGLTAGGPGGVQIAVDADGTANQYDQQGFSSPATNNNSTDFFWLNQTPAKYSFSLTNFPSPASAPGFDSHVYLINGDSTAALWNGAWGYNQTYSGVPYNAPDYAGLRVQNGTNGGVVAIFEWKTNSPNANAPTNNQTVFRLPSYASANGTWALNFSDNTHLKIDGPAGLVGNVTLPDFQSDPNYTGNFTPSTSMVQFGVAKNDGNNTGVNNNKGCIFSQVLVTNANVGTIYDDGFTGPGLTANNNWQVAEYYLDAANRLTWIPGGTAWWVKWNSTQIGWSLQSSSNLLSSWSSAGVTYTYVDNTGTNTVGAVPATNAPAGAAGFFRLIK